jgi:hypothetical protein
MFTSVYAPKIITQAPAASPSRPSVRFTPLLAAAMSRITQRTTSTTGSLGSQSMSRRKEMNCDAGLMLRSSGNWSASSAKTIATIDWPAILALLRSPSDRCFLILMKSSRKPTTPSPVKRKSTSSPEADGSVQVIRWLMMYASRTEAMITSPPMVGVPRLTWCDVGPSSRMSWP